MHLLKNSVYFPITLHLSFQDYSIKFLEIFLKNKPVTTPSMYLERSEWSNLNPLLYFSTGYPGDKQNVEQWKVACQSADFSIGQIAYLPDATLKGNSGSPLFRMVTSPDGPETGAVVYGVHVGFDKKIGKNISNPIIKFATWVFKGTITWLDY